MSIEIGFVLGCLNDCGAEIPSALANGRLICSKKCADELNEAYHKAYPKAKDAYDADDIWQNTIAIFTNEREAKRRFGEVVRAEIRPPQKKVRRK